jgi:integrase
MPVQLAKVACQAAELPDVKPHSLRDRLGRVGQKRARSAEQMKAWSQNLGHESMLTTFTSYGTIPDYRQREIVIAMRGTDNDPHSPKREIT